MIKSQFRLWPLALGIFLSLLTACAGGSEGASNGYAQAVPQHDTGSFEGDGGQHFAGPSEMHPDSGASGYVGGPIGAASDPSESGGDLGKNPRIKESEE